MPEAYDPHAIETKWRLTWRRNQAFAPPPAEAGQPSRYVYACTPFTTGKAHMGHVRSYTIADACARRARSQGEAVLWAMGYDAFGLPNEIAAISHKTPPAAWVEDCRQRMSEQFERLGLSTDPARTFVSSEPDYYRWTQWAFLQFHHQGLVYRAEGVENWCDQCACVLAALQITDEGRCWRCDGPVRLSCVPQWYLRISPYAEELERGLDGLTGWDEAVIACQRSLFGRTDGAEIDLTLPSGAVLPAFLAHPDALCEVDFVALSPNHPDLGQIADRSQLDFEAQRRRSLSRRERSLHRIDAVTLDLTLSLFPGGPPLPVVVTPAVDMRFGGGAALGTPSRDPVDAAIAEQLMIASAPEGVAARPIPVRGASRYRLRDNSISRQRSWGAPVPMIHCDACGVVPVPEVALPVRLPEDIAPTGRGSALADHPSFADCLCPQCQGPARRDTDTLDVHVDSIWMLVPFCVPAPARDSQMFTHPDLQRWLPVSQVVCGADQAGWWMNDRLFFKVLRDRGYLLHLPDAEPVSHLLMHEMVLAGGRKMSKSLGNAVDPDELLARWGADVVRLAVLKVNPRKAFNWTDEALEENRRFLTALWDMVAALPKPSDLTEVAQDPGRRRLAAWRDAAARKAAQAYGRQAFHQVQKELKFLFELVCRFVEKRGGAGALSAEDGAEVARALTALVEGLEPLAPHICAELRLRLASESGLLLAKAS
jgi:leucyl-tRNA synthetase